MTPTDIIAALAELRTSGHVAISRATEDGAYLFPRDTVDAILRAAELGARTLEILSGAEESGCIKSVYAETARLARNLNLLPGPSPEKEAK